MYPALAQPTACSPWCLLQIPLLACHGLGCDALWSGELGVACCANRCIPVVLLACSKPESAPAHAHPLLLSMLRVLLFGAPADSSMAEALTQAALDVSQDLPGQRSASASAATAAACPGSLQALLRVVMCGAGSLTHAELLDAASHILQLAGHPADDVMVAELSQQIRQVKNGMCMGPACVWVCHVSCKL